MTKRDLAGRAYPIASREADAADLAELLATLDERERDVNAFVHLDPDLLGDQSEHVHLDPVPRLAGQVVAVKDNIAVRGAPWAAGSASRLGNPAEHDAELVRRLRAAGAVIVGTTNLDELAMGGLCEVLVRQDETTRQCQPAGIRRNGALDQEDGEPAVAQGQDDQVDGNGEGR